MAWHNGAWWPLYVPEWYAPRVSQHFFDPYTFCHILHGFIFFAAWGWWPELVWGYAWWWVWVVGAAISLLAELTHELVENSAWMIQLYRNNSGTSSLYEGDSSQNIAGDLIACTFGWYLTALCVHYNVWWIILIWTVVSETALLFYMRDNGILVCIQLTCPSEAIKRWQAEKVPVEGKGDGRGGTEEEEQRRLQPHP